MKLSKKELDELREIIRQLIGNYVDKLTEEDLNEFGIALLQATATSLKAKYNSR
jgi:hypothetical protein